MSPYEQAKIDASAACGLHAEKSAQLIDRYAKAVERESLLRDHWSELGQPVICFGGATGKAEVVHPLIARIEAAETHAQRLATDLGLLPGSRKGQMGRPQERVPERGAAEPPRLRSVS